MENDQLSLQRSQLESEMEEAKRNFAAQVELTQKELQDQTEKIGDLETKLAEAQDKISSKRNVFPRSHVYKLFRWSPTF